MKTSKRGLDFIKQFEFAVLHTYWGSGSAVMIGYKHKWSEGDDTDISLEDADRILVEDLEPIERIITTECRVKLNQDQFDSLVDYGFSRGVESLKNLLAICNTYEDISNMLVQCDCDNALLKKRTMARRIEEQKLFD